jgi:hypothetical protein
MAISALLGTLVATAGTALVKVGVDRLAARLAARKWAKEYAKSGEDGGKEAPPPAVFAAQNPAQAQASAPQRPSSESEIQSIRVKQLLIETELVEGQKALRRLRLSLDEAELEINQKTGALVLERNMHGETRAELVLERSLHNETRTAAWALMREYEALLREGPTHETVNMLLVASTTLFAVATPVAVYYLHRLAKAAAKIGNFELTESAVKQIESVATLAMNYAQEQAHKFLKGLVADGPVSPEEKKAVAIAAMRRLAPAGLVITDAQADVAIEAVVQKQRSIAPPSGGPVFPSVIPVAADTFGTAHQSVKPEELQP